MSSQSAALRTASQATVNAYRPTIELPAPKVSDKRARTPKGLTLLSLLPVSILGWVALLALADWATRLLA